jgi:hypothetical protein
LRCGSPGLLRRRGRLSLGHPVAGHCLLGHPVGVRCRYRHAGRHSVSDSVGYASRHANAVADGLRDRHAVTQPIGIVAEPIQAVAEPIQAVAEPIQAVSDAPAEAIAHSVRYTERPAVPDQIRLAAARHSRVACSDIRT